MERQYDYPVWGTQGGGLVREVNGTYIFVEKPDCPGLNVGDVMPNEWGITPANIYAQNEINQMEQWGPEDQAAFGAGLDQIFDMLFDKAATGEISLEQLGSFFPD